MAKKMLIDATHAEETRVVVVDGNKVEEFDFETVNKRQLAGNIYLAKVTRVEPSLQAAFVDYGGNRHGFLAFSEIHPDYYQIPVADRQALLAEEREMNRDEEEEGGDDPKKSRTRSRRSRSRSRKDERPEDTGKDTRPEEIDGMSIVDLDQDSEESEELTAPVEVIEDVERPVAPRRRRTRAAASAPETTPQAEPGAEPVETVEPAAETGDEAEPSAGSGRTMAARLEDDPADVVTSEVEEISTPGDEEAAVPAKAATRTVKRRASRSAVKETVDEEPDESDDNPASEIESVAEEDVQEEIHRPRKPRMRRYKIQEVIKVRQIMLVQVVKEERGNKGAALTTYLSLAGRYCVLMPNTARGGGISRKITNATDRKKLKEIASEIKVPEGAGLIIRTAGAQRTKAEIKRDYEYLKRLWEQIRDLTLKSIAPAPIYEEGNLIKRSIRDLYNRDIDEVFVEGDEGYRTAKDFMKMIMPSHAKNVKHYQDQMPLFARYQVESYLAGMFNPVVQLKSGGYIVIGVTEALVAIDVNSGRATKEGSIEETALKTNLEAADEVARQLRLRDLAGLIVIDFIDMEERKNNAAVEKRFKDRLKTDRARIQVGRISGFGLLEMSRQRLRPGMLEVTTQPCPACHGTGLLRSDDSIGLQILRQLEEEGGSRRCKEVLVKVPVGINNFLMNRKREHIAHIEAQYGLSVRVEADPSLVPPDFTIEKLKTATRPVPEPAPVVSVDTSKMPEEEDVDDEPDLPEETEGAEDDGSGKKKRRRRRRRRGGAGEDGASDEATSPATEAEMSDAAEETDAPVEQPAETASEEDGKRSRPRRRRSRRRSDAAPEGQGSDTAADEGAAEADASSDEGGAEVSEPLSPEPDAFDTPLAEPGSIAPTPAEDGAEVVVAEPEEPVVADIVAEAAVIVPEAVPAADDAVVASIEPAAEDVPAAPEPEPLPEEPAKPKRQGWWSSSR